MTRHYLPRPGSYPEAALAALKERGAIGLKKIHSGVLARLIGCHVSSLARVLEFAVAHGVIILERRPHAGNWYGLPEEAPVDVPASRLLPPSSIFELGQPPREVAIRRNNAKARTTLVGRARFAIWSDGDIQIDRGRQSMTLSGDEARALAALVAGRKVGEAA